jgi:RND superfamily putative drug exporter
MICVFSAFVLSGDMEGAMAGIGLAAAVALDAFILRTALVPAAMHLLGNSNWWLPTGLEKRLPHLAVEPKEETDVQEPARPEGGASVVHGFVRDPDGAQVEDASETLLSKGGRQLDRVTSLADGSYILSVPSPGAYLLAATAPSYGSRARQVTVEDVPLVYDVELPEASEEGADEVDAVN